VDVKHVPLTDPSLPADPKIVDLIEKSKKSLAFTQNLVIYPNPISAKGVKYVLHLMLSVSLAVQSVCRTTH
jgi:hypothetical protein